MEGLRDDFKSHVNLHTPKTLSEAIQHAIAFENSGAAESTSKKKQKLSEPKNMQKDGKIALNWFIVSNVESPNIPSRNAMLKIIWLRIFYHGLMH